MKYLLPHRRADFPHGPAPVRVSTLHRVSRAGVLAVLLLLASATVRADPAASPSEQTLATYSWPDALKETLANPHLAEHVRLEDPTPDEIRAGITGKIVTVSNQSVEVLRVPLLTVPTPPVTKDFYALSGQVSYADVRGSGFLEMWSVFPPEAAGGGERMFFSRTLGDTPGDPMEQLLGTSGWRPVLLPFNAAGAHAHPARLVVNLVLPSKGTVRLGPLRLAQYDYGSARPAAASQTVSWQWLAVVGAALLAVLGGFVVWRTSRRRRAAEWRRMAAHDASVGGL